MSETELLRDYVRRAIEAGQGRAAIRETLTAAGWSEAQADRALEAWAELPGPLAVPRPRAHLSAREAFLYLTMFAALYLTAWYLGSLLFDLIETAIPDAADRDWAGQVRTRSIRWAVAALVVGAPLYLWLSHRLSAEMVADPVRRASPVRQWLGHLTLFLAAVVLIGAAMTTVYNLLIGELTLRFLLKIVTVGAIAAAIFGWYVRDLRDERGR